MAIETASFPLIRALVVGLRALTIVLLAVLLAIPSAKLSFSAVPVLVTAPLRRPGMSIRGPLADMQIATREFRSISLLELGSICAIEFPLIPLEVLRLMIGRNPTDESPLSIALPGRLIRLLGIPATFEETHSATAAFPGRDALEVGLASMIPLPLTAVSLVAPAMDDIPKFSPLSVPCVLLRAQLSRLGMATDPGFMEN